MKQQINNNAGYLSAEKQKLLIECDYQEEKKVRKPTNIKMQQSKIN